MEAISFSSACTSQVGSDDEEGPDCDEQQPETQADEQSAEADSMQCDESMRSYSMASDQAPLEDRVPSFQGAPGPPDAKTQKDAPITKLSHLVQVSRIPIAVRTESCHTLWWHLHVGACGQPTRLLRLAGEERKCSRSPACLAQQVQRMPCAPCRNATMHMGEAHGSGVPGGGKNYKRSTANPSHEQPTQLTLRRGRTACRWRIAA